MTNVRRLWRRSSGTAFRRATVALDTGIARVTVSGGADRDAIRLLVRAEEDIAHRGVPIAAAREIHAIGGWPEHAIVGMQLDANKNGRPG